MPVVRKIARDAERDNTRFSSLILGIVRSDPFQMRMAIGSNVERGLQPARSAE
jgi:hypothetical protein